MGRKYLMIKFIEKFLSKRKRLDFHENQELDNLLDNLQQSLLAFRERDKISKNSQKYVQRRYRF